MSTFRECMKSELDLFSLPTIQTSILKTEEISYKPLTSLENQNIIDFVCYGHGDTCIDLSSIHLNLKIQVLKNDGSQYVEEDKEQPSLVNNIMHSLFRQINLSLNGKTVNVCDNHYAYRSYIESLLNYGSDASKCHLPLGGWSLDDNSFDELAKNNGAKQRGKLTKNSKILDLYGKLHVDMLNQHLLLLNGVDLRLSLLTNRPEFYIHGIEADKSIVRIVEATLYVKHCTINPNVLIAHQKMLEIKPAKYHYKRCEIKSSTVNASGNSLSIDNLVLGQIPSSLIFFMVDNDAYYGARHKSPFKFQNNSITSFSMYVNGMQVPNDPIVMNFENDQYARAYSTIAAATGILHTPQGNLIQENMFSKGYFILAFDLSPDQSNNQSNMLLASQGNIRLDIRFQNAPNKTITCLTFLEYDSLLKIDKNRNVILDY